MTSADTQSCTTKMAQPEPEVVGPTDEELLELHGWMTDEWAANHDFELPPSQYARAVLARWGRPAMAPAGEVADLVAWLRLTADEQPHTSGQSYIRFTRAADLLERQAAPVPVAVSTEEGGAQ